INFLFPNRLSYIQAEEMEHSVSHDEIKQAVWDCGTNKSPCLYGFYFEFFRKYQNIVDHDVVVAVNAFISKRIVAEKKRDSSLSLSVVDVNLGGGAEEEHYSHLLSRVDEVWRFLLSSGEFPVKLVRILIDDMFLLKEAVHMRWVNVVPLKVNILAWRVWLDKLPTRINLSLRGVKISYILRPLCSVPAESTSHLFFSYSLARQARSKVLRWWGLADYDIHLYEE
ncbi:RNA-directed DNA polymerase, eukaryota, partial [Tanacetum coccineum]